MSKHASTLHTSLDGTPIPSLRLAGARTSTGLRGTWMCAGATGWTQLLWLVPPGSHGVAGGIRQIASTSPYDPFWDFWQFEYVPALRYR